jgi:3-oxoadipate enol-lactonase
MTMPQVISLRARLFYEDVGSGPVMLLSHSWFCDGRQWPQVPALVERGYRVINLDNRGHGRSGPHRQPFTMWDMADDLILVLDHAEVDQAILVGLSIGGFAALRATLRYPDRVRGLVLVDTGATTQGLVNRAKIAVLGPGLLTPARARIMPQVVNALFGPTARREQPDLVAIWQDRFLAQDPGSMMTAARAFVGREDLTDRLPEIAVPTLVIIGEEDHDPGAAAAVSMAAHIPGARLVALPDTGHLCAIEAPDAFLAALLDFSDNLPVPATDTAKERNEATP